MSWALGLIGSAGLGLLTTGACAPAGTAPSDPAVGSSAPAPDGRLVNPKLADGTPVMMGFDSHHPDCFTFPSDTADSVKVECPENAFKILESCRGARLYAKATFGDCVCVPVADGETTELPCPRGIEAP